MSSPDYRFPYPVSAQERSVFLRDWIRDPRVKRVYGDGTTAATVAGIRTWNKAKLESEVSVTTDKGEFLVFDGPIY